MRRPITPSYAMSWSLESKSGAADEMVARW